MILIYILVSFCIFITCFSLGLAIWAYQRFTKAKCKDKYNLMSVEDANAIQKSEQAKCQLLLAKGIVLSNDYPDCQVIANSISDAAAIYSEDSICQQDGENGLRNCMKKPDDGCPTGYSEIQKKNDVRT